MSGDTGFTLLVALLLDLGGLNRANAFGDKTGRGPVLRVGLITAADGVLFDCFGEITTDGLLDFFDATVIGTETAPRGGVIISLLDVCAIS